MIRFGWADYWVAVRKQSIKSKSEKISNRSNIACKNVHWLKSIAILVVVNHICHIRHHFMISCYVCFWSSRHRLTWNWPDFILHCSIVSVSVDSIKWKHTISYVNINYNCRRNWMKKNVEKFVWYKVLSE